jgi:hypothetical protein
MAWKEGLRFAGPEARRIHDAAFPHAPLAPGKEIRITFEEEVSECCEGRQRQDLDTLARRFEKAAGTISACMPTVMEFAAVLRSSAGERECCKKWRGGNVYTITDGSRFVAGGTVLMHSEAKFCPECGRRL